MNRRRKLLIPLLFCGAMLTACDDKSAENAAAMTPEVGVVTLSPGSVNVLSELPGRTVPYEVAESFSQAVDMLADFKAELLSHEVSVFAVYVCQRASA